MSKNEKKRRQYMLPEVREELGPNPYHGFNIAFALTAIIPMLAVVYLFASHLNTVEIFVGNPGLIMGQAIFIAICGFALGYGIILRILRKSVYYAAKAKNESKLKSKFVASVSHEFRSPLTALQGNLELIASGRTGEITENQKEKCDLCLEVINRMTYLVNGLLDVYKIEAGMVELKKVECDLAELIRGQVKEFDIEISKKSIELIVEAPARTLIFEADREMILEVINNLLGNAVKYTPEGGKLSVKAFRAGEYVRMEVRETAPNIPEDKLELIFEEFERLDEDKAGKGLGLAIAKDIVEFHRGRIWVETLPAEGNKFIVVLPVKLPAAEFDAMNV
jgi:signal transduction histidine kinase